MREAYTEAQRGEIRAAGWRHADKVWVDGVTPPKEFTDNVMNELTKPIGSAVPVLYNFSGVSARVCFYRQLERADPDIINVRALVPEDEIRPAIKRILENHLYDGPRLAELLGWVEEWLAAYRRGEG